MYVYNVTLKVNAERADEWIQWMKHEHIPEVLATGIFSDYRITVVRIKLQNNK